MQVQPSLTFDDDLVHGNWVQMASAFIQCPTISSDAKALYALLLTFAQAKETAYPGQGKLSEYLGISEKPLRKALLELEEVGMLRIKRRGQGKTNLYHVAKWQGKTAESPVLDASNLPFQNGQISRSRTAESPVLFKGRNKLSELSKDELDSDAGWEREEYGLPHPNPKPKSVTDRERHKAGNEKAVAEAKSYSELLSAIRAALGDAEPGNVPPAQMVGKFQQALRGLLIEKVTVEEIPGLVAAMKAWGDYAVTPNSLLTNIDTLRREASRKAPPASAAPPADAPRRGRDFAKERFVMDPTVEFAVAPRKGLEAEIMGEDWAYERGGAGSLKYLALICQMGDPEAQEVFEYPPLNPAYVPHSEDGQFDYILTAAQENYKRRGLDSTGRVALRVAA